MLVISKPHVMGPLVQRMPCPTNTSVRTVIFLDLFNGVPGLGTELMRYRVSELGLPCRGFTPLFRLQGEQHILASSKQQQQASKQAVKKSLSARRGSKLASK